MHQLAVAQWFRLGGTEGKLPVACRVLVLLASSGDHVRQLLLPATFLTCCWPPRQFAAPDIAESIFQQSCMMFVQGHTWHQHEVAADVCFTVISVEGLRGESHNSRNMCVHGIVRLTHAYGIIIYAEDLLRTDFNMRYLQLLKISTAPPHKLYAHRDFVFSIDP
nr:uncharacterized protein LOC127344362 isoform X2 [Lolium perenne]